MINWQVLTDDTKTHIDAGKNDDNCDNAHSGNKTHKALNFMKNLPEFLRIAFLPGVKH